MQVLAELREVRYNKPQIMVSLSYIHTLNRQLYGGAVAMDRISMWVRLSI